MLKKSPPSSSDSFSRSVFICKRKTKHFCSGCPTLLVLAHFSSIPLEQWETPDAQLLFLAPRTGLCSSRRAFWERPMHPPTQPPRWGPVFLFKSIELVQNLGVSTLQPQHGQHTGSSAGGVARPKAASIQKQHPSGPQLLGTPNTIGSWSYLSLPALFYLLLCPPHARLVQQHLVQPQPHSPDGTSITTALQWGSTPGKTLFHGLNKALFPFLFLLLLSFHCSFKGGCK